ncbi:MAG TPA: cupin domain-containing protein [Streptosporangiaceae bacterium]|nr:cupin domain-containing protein [Streptosporangiaceae bacterium]
MTATTIANGTRIPPVSEYGVIFNDASGLGEIDHLVGGTGSCRWKTIINGMHLPGAWNVVEYVVVPPGASCGEHRHADTEEIYYILSGGAEMCIDGSKVSVRAGDLITCPIGTVHGIANHGDCEMRFFVVEVFPAHGTPAQVQRIPVHEQLRHAQGYRGYDGDDLRVAQVNLSWHFTGPWRTFSEIEIPPEEAIGPYQLPRGTAEVLFVVEGEADVTAGSLVRKGGHGLCVGAALGSTLTVRNRSDSRPLRLISTEVRAGWI